ncbi:MAG: acyl-CoA dehydrogenase family protein [Acidimicrobiales bacterium]
MDFTLTDDQELFAKTIHDWVDRECPKTYANHLERQEFKYPYELWDRMTAAGLHGIGIDEEYGGQGGDVITQTIVARQLARSLAGLTWVWGISSFAGGKSVGLYGSDEQKGRFLPDLAAGRLRFAMASEYAAAAADAGIQLLGGMGYAAETDMQRYWRDCRIYRIAPITNEMVRNMVAESLGLLRSF